MLLLCIYYPLAFLNVASNYVINEDADVYQWKDFFPALWAELWINYNSPTVLCSSLEVQCDEKRFSACPFKWVESMWQKDDVFANISYRHPLWLIKTKWGEGVLFHRDICKTYISIAKQHINEYWGGTKRRKREDISVLLISLMRGNMLTLLETITGYSYLLV